MQPRPPHELFRESFFPAVEFDDPCGDDMTIPKTYVIRRKPDDGDPVFLGLSSHQKEWWPSGSIYCFAFQDRESAELTAKRILGSSGWTVEGQKTEE